MANPPSKPADQSKKWAVQVSEATKRLKKQAEPYFELPIGLKKQRNSSTKEQNPLKRERSTVLTG